MASARLAGVGTMMIYTLVTRQSFLPAKPVWSLLILNGALDVSGNGLYILAGHFGRMDVAAILASLYPASTVMLAGLILHERLSRLQLIGILAALAAILLMTI
jgi:drug/metabolite transporter (DMT)-like permease